MPYIKPDARVRIAEGAPPRSPGELNYVITQALLGYFEERCEVNDGDYQTFNDMIGVLECAKLELYRRYVQGYEDEKIKQNGDVY